MSENRNYLREQILEAQGKNVTIDYFLYSCFEHEKMRRATLKDEADDAHGRWPVLFGVKLSNLPPALSEKDLGALLKQMCLWYASQYPELVEDMPMDHAQLSLILDPFVKLTLDMADLVFLKTGQSLPSATSSEPNAVLVWNSIRGVIKSEFAPYEDYFVRFLDWTFGEDVGDVSELGSRPPVGKFAPSFKQRQAGLGQTPHGARTESKGREGRDPRQNHGRNAGKSFGNRPHVERGGNANRGGAQQKPQHDETRTAQLEQEAIAAVDEAISKLNSDSELEEVFLKPVNSFYRRIQHQYAVDKGFNSCSVGDGNERGVKISKKLAD